MNMLTLLEVKLKTEFKKKGNGESRLGDHTESQPRTIQRAGNQWCVARSTSNSLLLVLCF